MGSVSLLAASLVVAFLGFGWFNALKEGVFDIFRFLRNDSAQDAMEDVDNGGERDNGDAMTDEKVSGKQDAGVGADIEADPEFDDELNALDDELNSLLDESESELETLEGEL